MTDVDWTRGACAPAPRAPAADIKAVQDLFFADHPSGQVVSKAHCFGCPIQFECLRFSLNSDNGGPERFGVWGGLSSSERFALSEMLTSKGINP